LRIHISTSTRIFIVLAILMGLLSALNMLLPQTAPGSGLPAMDLTKLPAPLPVMMLAIFAIVLVAYGGLGFVGLKLSQNLGIPNLVCPEVSNRQRFGWPALVGGVIGIFLIVMDLVFTNFFAVAPLQHPPFPTSLVASLSAGIGEEIIFRLFFITFWTWLISYVILRRRWLLPVYWVISTFSAVAFSASHFPALMYLQQATGVNQFSPALIVEIFLLNGLLSLVAAYFMKKSGYLAAVGVHFWADVVWHVVWGVL
jgi:hypothetical protein